MKQIISIISLFALAACATVTGGKHQSIGLRTNPLGAECTLRNNAGSWTLDKTPGSVNVERDFSPLHISCTKGDKAGEATLEPGTRQRAYGNILMLGVPAVVDAYTGDGYHYDVDNVTIELN